MKKILAILLAILCFNFVACNDSTNNNNKEKRFLVDTIVDYYELDIEWQDKIAELFSVYDTQINKLRDSKSLSEIDLLGYCTIIHQASQKFRNDFKEREEFLLNKKDELSKEGDYESTELAINMGQTNLGFYFMWYDYDLVYRDYSNVKVLFEATMKYINEMTEFFYGEKYLTQSEIEEILEKW